MMKRQLERPHNPVILETKETKIEPIYEYHLPKQAKLPRVLCNFSTDLSPQEIRTQNILAVNLMTALCSQQEHQTHKPRLTKASLSNSKQQSPSPPPKLPSFPIVCKKRQCIFCLGNEQLSY